MKLAVLGALIGSGFFIGGFARHDINHNSGDSPFDIMWTATNEQYTVPGFFYTDSPEHRGYELGMFGAAVLTISVKHIWDRRKGKTEVKKHYGKIRKALDVLIGGSLVVAGAKLHDYGRWENDGLVRWQKEDGTWGPFQDRKKNTPEHLGFAVGTLGAVWFSLPIKHSWDSWKPGWNQRLDIAYTRFRARVKDQGGIDGFVGFCENPCPLGLAKTGE